MGVVQNSPIFTPGVAKAASSDGHRQVAGGHQLASGGGGNALHFGDDRLRDGSGSSSSARCRRRRCGGIRRCPARVISERSWPEQKTLPAAARITARISRLRRRSHPGSRSVPASDRARARCGVRPVQGHHRERSLGVKANVFVWHGQKAPQNSRASTVESRQLKTSRTVYGLRLTVDSQKLSSLLQCVHAPE